MILLVEYNPTNHKEKVQERNGVSEALNWQVLSSVVSQKGAALLIAGVKEKQIKKNPAEQWIPRTSESGSSYLRGKWSAAIGSFSACRCRRKTAPARRSPPSCCGREGPPPLCRTAGGEKVSHAWRVAILICTTVGNKLCTESRCFFLFYPVLFWKSQVQYAVSDPFSCLHALFLLYDFHLGLVASPALDCSHLCSSCINSPASLRQLILVAPSSFLPADDCCWISVACSNQLFFFCNKPLILLWVMLSSIHTISWRTMSWSCVFGSYPHALVVKWCTGAQSFVHNGIRSVTYSLRLLAHNLRLNLPLRSSICGQTTKIEILHHIFQLKMLKTENCSFIYAFSFSLQWPDDGLSKSKDLTFEANVSLRTPLLFYVNKMRLLLIYMQKICEKCLKSIAPLHGEQYFHLSRRIKAKRS